MSSLVISGDTSGSVTLQAPAVAGTTVLTLPATSGTVITSASGTAATATNLAGGSNGTIPYQSASGTTQMLAVGTSGQYLKTNGVGAPSWATVSAGFTLGTPVATTSGTSIDFTGIPAGTKQIVISFKNVSTSGNSLKQIQIGDSGGIETSGYDGAASAITTVILRNNNSSGYIIRSTDASERLNGSITLTLENSTSFTWTASGILSDDYGTIITCFISGSKSLSAELDRIRITTDGGTNTFDFGEVNIAYI